MHVLSWVWCWQLMINDQLHFHFVPTAMLPPYLFDHWSACHDQKEKQWSSVQNSKLTRTGQRSEPRERCGASGGLLLVVKHLWEVHDMLVATGLSHSFTIRFPFKTKWIDMTMNMYNLWSNPTINKSQKTAEIKLFINSQFCVISLGMSEWAKLLRIWPLLPARISRMGIPNEHSTAVADTKV